MAYAREILQNKCIGVVAGHIYFIFIQVILTNEYYEEYKLKNNIFINLIVYCLPVTYLYFWIYFSEYIDWWNPYQNKLFTPIGFLL